MRNQGVFWVGGLLVLAGVIFLAGNLFNFNAWLICWPVLFISVGVWLLIQPRLNVPGMESRLVLIGDYKRSGSFDLQSESIVILVGDLKFDCTAAMIPDGDTTIKISGFVGDVKLVVPDGVGVLVNSAAMVSDVTIFEQHQNQVFGPLEMANPGYAQALKKIRIEAAFFVGNVKVKRSQGA